MATSVLNLENVVGGSIDFTAFDENFNGVASANSWITNAVSQKPKYIVYIASHTSNVADAYLYSNDKLLKVVAENGSMHADDVTSTMSSYMTVGDSSISIKNDRGIQVAYQILVYY